MWSGLHFFHNAKYFFTFFVHYAILQGDFHDFEGKECRCVMKIGEFSRLHNVSTDTVRFYVNEGLLVPVKDGYHYQFDQQCSEDFSNIIQLKDAGFSLQDIKFLILSENVSRFAPEERAEKCRELFLQKREEITALMEDLNRARSFLDQKLESLSYAQPASADRAGISLNLIPLLACPHCQSQLLLQSNCIEQGMILSGTFICPDCAYRLEVADGILIATSTEKVINSYDSYDSFIAEADPNQMVSILQNIKWMKSYLYKDIPDLKVILELGSGFGFFLRNTYEMIPDNAIYLAVDYDIRRHRFLQKALRRCSCHKNIVLLCCSYEDIPIRKHTVDQLIDFGASTDLAWYRNAFALDLADPYTHPGTSCIFVNRLYDFFSFHSPVEPALRQNLQEKTVLSKIQQLGYQIQKRDRLEFLDKLQPSNQFMDSEDQIYRLMLYMKKQITS